MGKIKLFGVLIIFTFTFLATGCGSKLAGTFVGYGKISGGGYNNDESLNDVKITIENKSSHEYYVIFGENSPIQCKLLLDNSALEDNDKTNDDDLYFRRLREERTCELRGKDGGVQTAKISKISGGRLKDGYLSLSISLESVPSFCTLTYQGWD